MDFVFLNELLECDSQPLVVDAKVFAKATPSPCFRAVFERLHYFVIEMLLGWLIFSFIPNNGEVNAGLVFQAKGDGFHGRSGAVFNGKFQLVTFSREIDIAVAECVKVTRTSEALPRPCVSAFAGVVGEYDGDLVVAFEFPKISEESGDLSCAVFIETMKTDKGIKKENFRLQTLDGRLETGTIVLGVEAHDRSRDEMHVDLREVDTSRTREMLNATMDLFHSIFRHEDEGRARIRSGKAPQTRCARGNGQRHFQTQPTFTTFRLSSNDATGTF